MDYKGGKDRDYKKNFIEEVQKIYNKFLTKKCDISTKQAKNPLLQNSIIFILFYSSPLLRVKVNDGEMKSK